MRDLDILVIGGGIGGLTAALALRANGHRVCIVERDPEWSVYGVGIIQQGNVLRAMKQLGLLDDYLSSAVGFDFIAVHAPDGTMVAASRSNFPTAAPGATISSSVRTECIRRPGGSFSPVRRNRSSPASPYGATTCRGRRT